MKLRFTKGFAVSYKKLAKNDKKLKGLINKQFKLLLDNPKHPSLRLHKIASSGFWSISINESLRALVIFAEDTITVFNIGKHEDVYK
ncbi:MAG: plasmid stabilization protein [Patescibacteria group bacterium]|nr:type II toxin-antitoxin system RelE/ParE family toxin [Patescibacteria group bacterium]